MLKSFVLLFVAINSLCFDSFGQLQTESEKFNQLAQEMEVSYQEAKIDRIQFVLDSVSEEKYGKSKEFAFLKNFYEARIYSFNSEYVDCYLKINKAKSIYSPKELTREKSMMLFHVLGNIYCKFKQRDKFEQLLSEHNFYSNIQSQKVKNETKIYGLINIAFHKEYKEQRDSVLFYLNNALDISLENGGECGYYCSRIINNIGGAYVNLNENAVAKKYFYEVLALNEHIEGREIIVSTACNNLGHVYLESRNLDSAGYFLKRAEKKSLNVPIKIKSTIIGNLIEYYELKNDYKNAYKYSGVLTELKSKIAIKSSKIKIEQLNEEHRKNILKSKNNLLVAENSYNTNLASYRKNINWTLFGIISLLIIGIAIIWRTLKRLKSSYQILLSKNQDYQNIYSRYLALLKKPNTEAQRKPSALNSEFQEELMKRINIVIIEGKLYKNPELKIQDLCEELDTNRSYISETINQIEQKNFSKFINDFRVMEACKLLESKKEMYSIDGIANMVGFKSKSSFYNAFKQNLGVTPAFYATNFKNKST